AALGRLCHRSLCRLRFTSPQFRPPAWPLSCLPLSMSGRRARILSECKASNSPPKSERHVSSLAIARDYMTVDPFRLAIALVPLAAYVLLVGLLNVRRRP